MLVELPIHTLESHATKVPLLDAHQDLVVQHLVDSLDHIIVRIGGVVPEAISQIKEGGILSRDVIVQAGNAIGEHLTIGDEDTVAVQDLDSQAADFQGSVQLLHSVIPFCA